MMAEWKSVTLGKNNGQGCGVIEGADTWLAATNSLLMGISWNVHGLLNERRHGVVGKYLHEWGSIVVCFQETMLESCET